MTKAALVAQLASKGGTLPPADRARLGRLLEEGKTPAQRKEMRSFSVNTNSPRFTNQLYDPPPGGWGFPARYIKEGGRNTSRLARDADALLSLLRHHPGDRRLELALLLSDRLTQLETLGCGLDKDGRVRYSSNLAGTECISGDSYVFTFRGWRRMDTLFNFHTLPHIWNGEKFVKPERKVAYRDVAGWEITLESGFVLKGSANHPVMTRGGWKPLDQVEVFDQVLLQSRLPQTAGTFELPRSEVYRNPDKYMKEVRLPETATQDLAEFTGMWLADGSLNQGDSCGLTFANGDPDVHARLGELAQSLFGLRAHVYFSRNSANTDVYSKTLMLWAKALGLRGWASDKVVPPWLMESKESTTRALLRGLTLDSHFGVGKFFYGTQSPGMRRQIQLLLLRVGIVSSIAGNKLMISRNHFGDFANLIGFVQSRKANQMAEQVRGRLNAFHRTQIGDVWLPVKEKKPWRGDVFDLTMPKGTPPQYIANGFLVHNTQRHSCRKSPTGSGYNLHTTNERHKHLFLADEGFEMANVDLSGADGWTIAAEAASLGDATMLEDLRAGLKPAQAVSLIHQHGEDVNRRSRDELKQLAKAIDKNGWLYTACKKGVWGYAYGLGEQKQISVIAQESYAETGTPLWVDVAAIRKLRRATAVRYPGLAWRQRRIDMLLERDGFLEFANGSRRRFIGHPRDAATQREAYAAHPQVVTMWVTSLAWARLWRDPENENGRLVQPLLLVFDSLLCQSRRERRDWTCDKLRTWFDNPITIAGIRLTIPFSGAVGRSWAHASGVNGFEPDFRL